MSTTHLVVGAGQVGSAIATRLAAAGEDVVLVSRSGRGPASVRRVAADASSVTALLAAAPGAAVVYNAVNPAYHRWPQEWPPMSAAFLAYAEQTGAVLATVSNLYGYGPVDVPMREDLPLAATGTKARIRVTMWQDALAAHEAGRLRAVEVRGSDYVCSGSQSMLGDRVTPRVMAGKGVQVLGDPDAPHSWTDPRDVATTIIRVAADPAAHGRAWHVPSEAPRSQREAVADIAAAAGVAAPKVGVVPKVLLRGLGLVNPMIRELSETDYQRERPYVLDDTDARTLLGLTPTPWADSVARLVDDYRSDAEASRAAA
jgi:nucleoside-diphosphate-sugar epimerase